MIRLAVHGASGRMGREVVAAALADPEVRLVGAIARPGSAAVGQDAGTLAGRPAAGLLVSDNLAAVVGETDVVVDFTAPEASLGAVACARVAGKAVVVGTTGLSAAQIAELREAGSSIPVFVAPNMSVGVNLLLRVLPLVARALAGYDVEVVEAHHRHKKDAPSGTALKLAEVIAGALGTTLGERATYGRHGLAPRQPGEIGLHAVRAGGIVGEHTVRFVNDGEEVSIGHRAFSRQTFALGALRAAKYFANRPPGYYTFDDLLGG
ncbi:MAG: 4-hydroxy-tetrahydrodipicolinate reductase [Chloroflexi bacterium]|nr:4-hydroxy-tetrahydrodipicolinate reductase [Chloroflexota bacterium]